MCEWSPTRLTAWLTSWIQIGITAITALAIDVRVVANPSHRLVSFLDPERPNIRHSHQIASGRQPASPHFCMVVRCFCTLFLLVDGRYLKQAVDPLGLCTPYLQTPFSHLPTSHASFQERLKAVIGCHRLKAVIG